jgi:hypothetical protein
MRWTSVAPRRQNPPLRKRHSTWQGGHPCERLRSRPLLWIVGRLTGDLGRLHQLVGRFHRDFGRVYFLMLRKERNLRKQKQHFCNCESQSTSPSLLGDYPERTGRKNTLGECDKETFLRKELCKCKNNFVKIPPPPPRGKLLIETTYLGRG